mgnify:CR=1 FL=1
MFVGSTQAAAAHGRNKSDFAWLYFSNKVFVLHGFKPAIVFRMGFAWRALQKQFRGKYSSLATIIYSTSYPSLINIFDFPGFLNQWTTNMSDPPTFKILEKHWRNICSTSQLSKTFKFRSPRRYNTLNIHGKAEFCAWASARVPLVSLRMIE